MPRPIRSIHAALIASLLLARPLIAQEAGDRPFVDSLYRLLGHSTRATAVPPVSFCAGHSTQIRILCEAMIELRRNDFGTDRADLARARDLLERLVEERPRWPVPWYTLGVLRLRLVPAGMLSREGPLAPIGVSDETSASNALVRALELDSTYRIAALALAAAPIGREGPTRLVDRLAMLRRRQSLLDGPALYQAGLVEREAGHHDAAVYYDRDALRRGDVDSGLVELAMARDLYASGNPNEGRMMLIASAGDPTKAAHDAFRREFEWVATPEELKTWDSLPPASRSNWVADFWAQRDVRDGRAPGERLIEHYRRMEFAYRVYRLTLPQTGRQKAAGVAQTVDFAAADFATASLLRAQTGGNADLEELSLSALTSQGIAEMTGGDRSPFKVFTAPQDLIDDRGVVYVRHGPPDASARTVSGESLELWVYDRPDNPLVLSFREVNFDGQVGASKLVPTLLSANPLLRNQLCSLKTSICSTVDDPRTPTLTQQPPGGSPNPQGGRGSRAGRAGAAGIPMSTSADANFAEQQRLQRSGGLMRKEVADGMEAIATATTTDAYSQHFAHAVTPAVQIYGLDRADGGQPRVLATFAIPGKDLASASLAEAGRRTVYPIRVQLFAANRVNGTEYHLDTLRRFTTPRPLANDESIVGYVELPLPPGTYATSVTITQEDGHGAIANLGQVVLPGARPILAASDLVLGREGSSVRWNSGSTQVALNPLNTYHAGAAAEVYFQLSGMSIGETYTTRFEFFRTGDDPKRGARLSISFAQVAARPWMEISRNIGLKNLDPGQYRVKLTVMGRTGEATASGWVNIIK